jgi:hypothetical protein
LIEARAPRLGQIEIPLALVTDSNAQLLCSCLNISSSGAFLRQVDSNVNVIEGMTFTCQMLKKGKLSDVTLIVERVQEDGFGVRFISE